jgi:hypothetical protein
MCKRFYEMLRLFFQTMMIKVIEKINKLFLVTNMQRGALGPSGGRGKEM